MTFGNICSKITTVGWPCKIDYTRIPLRIVDHAWSKVLPEKLAYLQVVKKSPALYRTQKFISTVTRTCNLSLS
jgi:hypothetical protein